VRCGLSSGSGAQLCSPRAVLLWSWGFAVLIYWGLVSLPGPLFLRQGQWSFSWPPAIRLLWWFADFLQFCSVVWLWLLFTGSGDEICGLPPVLFQAVAYHLSTASPSSFSAFVYWKFLQRSVLALSPFSSVLIAPHSLCCELVFSSLFIQVFFFFQGRGSVCPGCYAGLSQGCLGEYYMMLGAHLLVCWMSPKQVWSRHLVAC
jgi:hypothetical protein